MVNFQSSVLKGQVHLPRLQMSLLPAVMCKRTSRKATPVITLEAVETKKCIFYLPIISSSSFRGKKGCQTLRYCVLSLYSSFVTNVTPKQALNQYYPFHHVCSQMWSFCLIVRKCWLLFQVYFNTSSSFFSYFSLHGEFQ